MIQEYDFTLIFALAGPQDDPELALETLIKADCDCSDALCGLGRPGRLLLDVTREGSSAAGVVLPLVTQVRAALPGSRLIMADPDLVGLTHVADLLGCSRQNIRKTALSDPSFPLPVHAGSLELFHLADILLWIAQSKMRPVSSTALEIAQLNQQLNLARQVEKFGAAEFSKLVRAAFR